MIYGQIPRIPTALLAATALGASTPAAAAADKANISGLSDVTFGSVTFTDQSISQSICVFVQNTTSRYAVIASGSGPAAAFVLSSGAQVLPYDLLWNALPGQTGGTLLAAGVAATGFSSDATQKTCNAGPTTSASLTIALRSSDLDSARAGTYSGTIQLTIVPE